MKDHVVTVITGCNDHANVNWTGCAKCESAALRAEVERWKEGHSRAVDEGIRLDAEVERLREKLADAIDRHFTLSLAYHNLQSERDLALQEGERWKQECRKWISAMADSERVSDSLREVVAQNEGKQTALAGEVERLKHDIDQIAQSCEPCKTVAALRAEVERLKEERDAHKIMSKARNAECDRLVSLVGEANIERDAALSRLAVAEEKIEKINSLFLEYGQRQDNNMIQVGKIRAILDGKGE